MPSQHSKPYRRSAHAAEPPLTPSSMPPDDSLVRGDTRAPADVALERLIWARWEGTGVNLGEVRLLVLDGVATLSGLVRDRKSQFMLEHAAGQVKGVMDIDNLLRIPSKRS